MREMDKKKDIVSGMAAKTINFEKIVLMNLERRAKEDNSTVSKLVNMLCRRIALTDDAYWAAMMKHFAMKFQEAKYMREAGSVVEDSLKEEYQLKE